MITFVLAAILIILATLALLIWPLLFTRNTFSYARHAQNIHYAKERLLELELQLKNASISATDYEALKLEIETTLAEDIDLANADSAETAPLPRRPNKLAISALCVFLPLGAAAVYTYVGTPEALNGSQVAASPIQHGGDQTSPQEINQMVSNLEQRLTESPNDLQGWALLSRTYLALGRYGKASNSLRQVLQLGGESAEIYASLADAIALAANGDMRGEPTDLAAKALALNPNNRQALWLSGLAAVQIDDKSSANRHWSALLAILGDQPAEKARLQEIMSEALGADYVAAATSNTSSVSKTVTDSNLANENTTGIEQNNSNGVPITISLAPEIADSVNPQDLVFIFARAVNGPPPPLAVKRLRVADLPVSISLSDQDAMVPQFKMSLFPDITVSARVSKSGQPVAQSGDFQSAVVAAKPGQQNQIELVIKTRIE